MDNELLRADVALVRRGLASSRERAQALIAGGLAYHNGHLLTKPAQKIALEDEVTVYSNGVMTMSLPPQITAVWMTTAAE